MKKNIILLTAFCFLSCLLFFGTNISHAQDETELKNKIAEYEKNISDLQNQANSLNQQISLMDNQIQVNTLKISQTQIQIKTLESDIATLSGKIGRLEGSLNFLSGVLLQRVAETYKSGKTNGISLLLSSRNFSDFISKYRYLQVVQMHDRELLLSMEQTRTSYDEQKTLKEKIQSDLKKLNDQLVTQKKQLASQIESRKKLLIDTQGKESNYQKLLAEAKAQLAALSNFTDTKSKSKLSVQETQSPDGWYFSQRDERWADQRIGNSDETMMEVGCLISCTAMLSTFYGHRVTPAEIASDASHFFSNTAYMLYNNWLMPPGKTRIALKNRSDMDKEIEAGNPVIVHLTINSIDGHFVVLKKRDGDNYIMHDPWEGFDKKFSDFYNVNSIDQIYVYK